MAMPGFAPLPLPREASDDPDAFLWGVDVALGNSFDVTESLVEGCRVLYGALGEGVSTPCPPE